MESQCPGGLLAVHPRPGPALRTLLPQTALPARTLPFAEPCRPCSQGTTLGWDYNFTVTGRWSSVLVVGHCLRVCEKMGLKLSVIETQRSQVSLEAQAQGRALTSHAQV